MKKLLLVDGNSMLFRAYYATIYTNPMTTSNGIPTNAVFGFINMLSKALDQIHPDAVLVAWDAGKPTFRHESYQDYKGTRKALDDELIAQMPIVREWLDASGLVRYEQEGYEADDIIGSMTASAVDMDVTILTSDKDLLQLIGPHAKVMLMKKGLSEMEIVDEAVLKERYDLKPRQIIDLKGLMGDPSDNIPGVKGVGEKTALKLLHAYGSVDGVYDHIDEIKGKLKEKLETGHESALMSKELATIYTQMHLPFDLENLRYHHPDLTINDFYHKYEMKSLLKYEAGQEEKETQLPCEETEALEYDPQKPSVLVYAASLEPFMVQKLYGFVLAQDGRMQYITAENARKDPGFSQVLQSKTVAVWGAKTLLHLLARNGFAGMEPQEDLMLATFLLYSQATSEESLVEALEVELPFPYRDLKKKTTGGDSMENMIPFAKALASALAQKQAEILKKIAQEDLTDLYRQVEMPLVPVLFAMEEEGIAIDQPRMKELEADFKARKQEYADRIYELAGRVFNIDSPKQLGEVLFDDLGLNGGKKRSTAVDVLEKLQGQHPIIDEVLKYRKYTKLVTTYLDGLKRHIIDGRIHTTFNQTMTQTGRLSSSDPNLQNISVKTEDGRRIREIFIPDPGHMLISADYSQIELRVLAHMADEQIMLQTFDEDVDIHRKTASEIFHVPADEVTGEMRRIAKTVNFGIIYGQTDFGLAQELHISRMEAKKFMQTYFASYPNIHRFMNQEIDFCKEHGYVETLMKRRRYIPEIKDKNFMTREFGKRAAMNAPIQGTAADLIKVAMLKVEKAIQEAGLKSRMLLQIHDELIFDVPEEEVPVMMELVQKTMDQAMQLNVPLKADVHAGANWAEAK